MNGNENACRMAPPAPKSNRASSPSARAATPSSRACRPASTWRCKTAPGRWARAGVAEPAHACATTAGDAADRARTVALAFPPGGPGRGANAAVAACSRCHPGRGARTRRPAHARRGRHPVPDAARSGLLAHLLEDARVRPGRGARLHRRGRPAARRRHRHVHGLRRLDDSTLTAVRAARFKPCRANGVAVSGWAFIPIEFELPK